MKVCTHVLKGQVGYTMGWERIQGLAMVPSTSNRISQTCGEHGFSYNIYDMVHNLPSWRQSPFASNRYGSRVSHLRLIPDKAKIVNAYSTHVPRYRSRQTDRHKIENTTSTSISLSVWPILPSENNILIDSSTVIQKQMHEYFFPKTLLRRASFLIIWLQRITGK